MDLDALYIINYKEAFASENEDRDDILIKLKFAWRQVTDDSEKEELKEKVYAIGKQNLAEFIVGL